MSILLVTVDTNTVEMEEVPRRQALREALAEYLVPNEDKPCRYVGPYWHYTVDTEEISLAGFENLLAEYRGITVKLGIA